MYFEYWHLHKPPFDNVPDPSMYADCHTSMENAIAETLFAIEEGNECLSVIIGDVGLGKTLSLRIVIDSLPPEKYQIALVTNPSISFVQLLNEIIGQLTESPCNEKKKAGLLETFNKLLFQTADAGKKIVLLIDEANAIAPANLESLRLLTNMQDDRRNLFTLVLAGQIELARRLEDPKRANLFQRIGTYSRIEKIGSLDQLKAYVETRMRLAGATRPVFTEETYPLFWEYSDQGVPRLINKIAKLSLKAGETHGLNQIDAQLVGQVGRQFEKITRSTSIRGKSKKKKEEPSSSENHEPSVDGRPSEPTNPPVSAETAPLEIAGPSGHGEGLLDSFQPIAFPLPQFREGKGNPLPIMLEKVEEAKEEESKSEIELEAVGSNSENFRSETIADDSFSQPTLEETSADSLSTPGEIFEEIELGKFKIRLHLPSQFVEQALSSNREDRFRMAGQAAVNAIKKFSELTSSPPDDPVSIWSELRSIIFKRLTPAESEMIVQ